MSTSGFDHIYIETHKWEASLAFWRGLGFELEYDTGHNSGALRHPNSTTTIFLAEQPWEDPVGIELYLGVADAASFEAPRAAEVVQLFTATHWGTRVMGLRDPDGRLIRVTAPA